ncbi:MAG: hypothetical protein ABSG55_09465, partial [Dehalococcoidia bacterium]
MIELLSSAILTFFVGGGAGGAFVLWLLNNPEKADAWLAWGYRNILARLRIGEYGNVATNIQAALNRAGKSLDDEAPGAMPNNMRIEWAKDAQAVEALLREGEIVVTMGYSADRDRNLAVATVAFVSKGLLPRARIYLDRTLMRAVDLVVAKGILWKAATAGAVSHLIDNYVKPEVETQPRLRRDLSLMETLETGGYFSHVFLRQLTFVGNRVFPALPDTAIETEIRGFADFLGQLAMRERGHDVNLSFARSRIRVGVILVARAETKAWGTEAYARRVRISRDRGIEHLYICGRGPDNIELAEQVATQQERAGTLAILGGHRFRDTAKGGDVNAICVACALRLLASEGPPDPSSAVYRVLEEHIPELAQGKMEVVAVARRVGVEAK